jgi:hypothetical protein
MRKVRSGIRGVRKAKYQNAIEVANPTEIKNSDLGLTRCKIESTINLLPSLVVLAKRHASIASQRVKFTPKPLYPSCSVLCRVLRLTKPVLLPERTST